MGNKSVKEFDNLYAQYSEAIFRYFAFRLNNKDEALDLTQETFVKIWNAYFRLEREIDNPKALLYKIAHNILVNRYERVKKNYSLDEIIELEQEPDDHESKENIINFSEGSILNENLLRLDPQDREIIYLRYYQDLSIKEVAEIVGSNENSVSVKIHRILEKLKKIYE